MRPIGVDSNGFLNGEKRADTRIDKNGYCLVAFPGRCWSALRQSAPSKHNTSAMRSAVAGFACSLVGGGNKQVNRSVDLALCMHEPLPVAG